MIRKQKITLFTLLITLYAPVILSSTITVSKSGGGQFSNIQEAVDIAESGDEIIIIDSETYEEQVTFDSTKNKITLRSESVPKPAIVWRDTIHTHPHTATETSELIVDYDRNGALRILGSFGIAVEGIKIDGKNPFIFNSIGVWDGMNDLFHGNAAITILRSGNVTIRDCDILNAFIGIYVKDCANGGVFVDQIDSSGRELSGFGSNGNHLIEQNRIHNNSWGMFFEGIWDLGSVVRYNLFYENHHYSEEFAEEIELYREGENHPGGAIFFKDNMLSPLAIYNNTFWHNFLLIVGHWQAGCQHLVFNNIYGKPHKYWYDGGYATYMEMTPVLVNRMHNCVYASQSGEQSKFAVDDEDTVIIYNNIINQFEAEKTDYEIEDTVISVINEGALIIDPFPGEAENRWLETKFISTDPDDPDFLTPDWNDSLVREFIVDKGWVEAGQKDADGSMADLGAIPSGGIPESSARITPLTPVKIDENQAILNFNLEPEGTFDNPNLKYFKVVRNLVLEDDAFASDVTPIEENDIVELPNNFSLKSGFNSIIVDIPNLRNYAFFEMVIEGSDSDGQKSFSSVGFIPYRKTTEDIKITVLDKDAKSEPDKVKSGDTVVISIDASGSNYMISPAKITLSSGSIKDLQNNEIEIDSINETVTIPAIINDIQNDESVCVILSGVADRSGLNFAISDFLTVKATESYVNKKKPDINIFDNGEFYTVYSVNGRVVYSGKEMSLKQLNSRMKMMGKGVFLVKRQSYDGKLKSIRKLVRY